MSHNITEFDKGAVGFETKLGKTWHNRPEYIHFPNQVPLEAVERIANYEVKKLPLSLQVGDTIREVEKAFCLYREDIDKIVYPSVGNVFTPVQNMEIIGFLEDKILSKYSNISIESAGTLDAGRVFFVNLIVDEKYITGDVSPTATRICYMNIFGAKSIFSCAHTTRIVCNNTLMIAEAQGAANNTLKKIRHTKTASDRLEEDVIGLADLLGKIDENYNMLNDMTNEKISNAYVDEFLTYMFPMGDEEGRKTTIAKNNQEYIKDLYFTKEDLKPLTNTRYKLLQAFTDFTSNPVAGKKEKPLEQYYMKSLMGTSNDINQKAFNFLTTV